MDGRNGRSGRSSGGPSGGGRGYPIVARARYGPTTFLLEVLAPAVARACEPGQFVMVRIDETGERIPDDVRLRSGSRDAHHGDAGGRQDHVRDDGAGGRGSTARRRRTTRPRVEGRAAVPGGPGGRRPRGGADLPPPSPPRRARLGHDLDRGIPIGRSRVLDGAVPGPVRRAVRRHGRRFPSVRRARSPTSSRTPCATATTLRKSSRSVPCR